MKLSRGETLALWRRRAGLTQAEFGLMVGLSQSAVSAWERAGPPSWFKLPALSPSPGEAAWLGRKRLGLTLREAAARVGVSHATLCAIEAGRRSVPENFNLNP